jgi:CheY-like chemotaxis protein
LKIIGGGQKIFIENEENPQAAAGNAECPHMSVFPSVVSPLLETDRAKFRECSRPTPAQILVLLIEDDELVADIVERTLIRFGKRVLRARDGTEGALLFAEYESEIALVILDCGLPDIDGIALCRVLRHHAPALPVILTSGWDNEAARLLAEDGPTAFLPKPFFPAQIEEQVAALVGAIA